jgi:hypothetical protein
MSVHGFQSYLNSVVLSVVLTAASSAAVAEAPRGFRIDGISYGGSGCPQGSVSENLSTSGDSLSLLFDRFVAEVGPGASPMNARANCKVSINASVPSGWSYSIRSVEYRGFHNLERGVSAIHNSGYYFQGTTSTQRVASTFVGPLSADFAIRDSFAAHGVNWSPCNTNRSIVIDIQTQLRSSDRRATGLATLDSDGSGVKYTLQFRRC